ncbi:MAG: endonuclease III [Lachnospiraceae bacterium]|jgi:endonuclease-3|nr:endonuclease III [Lachnospiraceae bacterium]
MKQTHISKILTLLDEHYGIEIPRFLNYEEDWQLLAATMLSAQCTDERVNKVTPKLFAQYRDVAGLALAEPHELEEIIRSTGFFRNKASNMIACFRMIHEQYNGEIPFSLEELTALPGIGRKTANVIRGNIFGDPAIVVDTHVKRVSRRLGLAAASDPVKIEFELMKILPREHWIRYNTQIISHGRKICLARKARCEECFFYSTTATFSLCKNPAIHSSNLIS